MRVCRWVLRNGTRTPTSAFRPKIRIALQTGRGSGLPARFQRPRIASRPAAAFSHRFLAGWFTFIPSKARRIESGATKRLYRRACFILFRRHQALQLLVPMLHDDEGGRRGARAGPGRFDHQKALTVRRHVVHTATGGAVAGIRKRIKIRQPRTTNGPGAKAKGPRTKPSARRLSAMRDRDRAPST